MLVVSILGIRMLKAAFTQELSVGLSVLLIVTYGLGMLFSLRMHRELFAGAEAGEGGKRLGRWVWPSRPWLASRSWWHW